MAYQIPTIRIALFGASAAGKTTLVSSYFGYQQRHAFEKEHGYRLSAVDPRDGNLLLKNYYGMQDGQFPAPTVSKDHTYKFEFKISSLPRPAFALEWLDYPGAWWDSVPADPQEEMVRRDCILKLLHSQVGFLLIDGHEYKKDRITYLARELDHFKNEVRRWQDFVTMEQQQGLPIIEEWVIALTKADLFDDDYSAERFCREVIKGAVDQLNGLTEAMRSPKFGTRFLLLSSAQVDRLDSQRVHSVDRTIGLELVAPAAFRSAIERIASERSTAPVQPELSWWQRVLVFLANFSDSGEKEPRVGERYQPLMELLRAVSRFAKFDVDQRAQEYRQFRQQAVVEGDALKAAAAAMFGELQGEAGRRAFYVSQD